MLRQCSCGMRKLVSSAAWLKGHKCMVRKEAVIPLLDRYHRSFNTTQQKSFGKTSDNDLGRFLIEIGTDPKEARYWLKMFTSSVQEPSQVFMVISVDDEVMQDQAQLETFASTIAFLYRNNMSPLIVYGNNSQNAAFKTTKDKCVWNALKLTNLLEHQGVYTRLLYPGCGVVIGQTDQAGLPEYAPEQLELDQKLLRSGFTTRHLPVLLSYGETPQGQMFAVDTWTLTSKVARLLQPMKVMLVNKQGGFLDEQGKVIANINLPVDLGTVQAKPWKTPEKIEIMTRVNDLLTDLPQESSVVITSADTMLRELFSHRGSGTFFRCTEAVHKYTSLEGIDLDRLRKLLHRSFRKALNESYFENIMSDIHAIYLSETYSGVAIVLHGERAEHVPYLCKFAVTDQAQGQGIGELLWDTLRQNEPSLFWRSKVTNPINAWYFKKCEGSWNNPVWTVFWYGMQEPSLASILIGDALGRKDTFVTSEVKVESPTGRGKASGD